MAITAGMAIAAFTVGGISAAATGDTIIDKPRLKPPDRKAGRL